MTQECHVIRVSYSILFKREGAYFSYTKPEISKKALVCVYQMAIILGNFHREKISLYFQKDKINHVQKGNEFIIPI